MGECVGFQAQIASVVELLANSAVAEICKLVDDGYAALRSQMDLERQKMEKENRVLRQKLREMDVKVRSYERRMRRRSLREEALHGAHFRTPEGPGPGPGPGPGAQQTLLALPPPSSESKSLPPPSKQEDTRLLAQVKQERAERDGCNLDLKVELNISSQCSLSSGGDPCEELPGEVLEDAGAAQRPASPPGATLGLSCRPWAKARPGLPLSNSLLLLRGGPPGLEAPGGTPTDAALKPEAAAEGRGPQPAGADELSSLDLPWMQERSSHLGAAYAAAQLGQGGGEAAAPSSSFPSQGGAESLEAPPTLLFTGSSHEMAAFAASFDVAPAAVAAAAPPPPPPPSAPASSQRRSLASREPLVCAVCGRMFPSTATLKLHQRVHTGERPYTCPHCGKGFGQPSNLRVHLLIHTGERRYRCTLCGKSFLSSSHLKRHRTVHTQEKPYSCSRCGQSFSQMCSVRRHRQQSQCGL